MSWGLLGVSRRLLDLGVLGASWAVFGPPWGRHGASWGSLGSVLERVGRVVGRLVGVLAASQGVLRPLAGVLWANQERFGGISCLLSTRWVGKFRYAILDAVVQSMYV